jgi:hypothetical protein
MHTDTTRKNGVVSTFLFYWCKGNALYGFGLNNRVKSRLQSYAFPATPPTTFPTIFFITEAQKNNVPDSQAHLFF